MIDLNLLEALVHFYHYETLSATAEVMHTTQSSLSRAMKKLEDELGVVIFDRRKNKLSLNETGIYTAEQSELLIKELSNFSSKIRDFSNRVAKYYIGSCAPGPYLFQIQPLLSSVYPNFSFSFELAHTDELLNGLLMSTYDLIVLDHPVENTDLIECHKLISESLYAVFPLPHPLSERSSVSFSDVNAYTFLMYTSVGVWSNLVYEKMPDSKIITIEELENLNQIATTSSMCSFSTNLSKKVLSYDPEKYKEIPFSDPEATITFYCVYRKKDASRWKCLHEPF